MFLCLNEKNMAQSETINIDGHVSSVDDSSIWQGTAIEDFMRQWCNGEDYVMGHTSGSTGVPKPVRLMKAAMRESARRTNSFFGLKPGDSIMLCLSTDYIAGKMVVVRAIVGGLRLVIANVASSPEWTGGVDFAAMVPMQLKRLTESEDGQQRLGRIKTLIVGGGTVDIKLKKQFLALKKRPRAFLTYGMTETYSHVAVAEINKECEYIYKPINSIIFAVDNRGCLVIHAPYISEEGIVTNDVVELLDGNSFRWLGRFDNVVNSGGLKLFPETIEKKIADLMPCRFYMAGEPDDTLGQRLVLKMEMREPLDKLCEKKLITDVEQRLNRYEKPRMLYYLPAFEETTSGKIKRK